MPRVLHLCPDERSLSGVAAYGAAFRDGLRAAGATVVEHPVPADATFAFGEVRAYAARAAELAARADVVHAEIGGGSAHELAAVRAALRDTRVPVVLTLHDPPRLIWTPHLGRRLRESRAARAAARALLRRRRARVERSVLAGARHVFVLSALGRDALLRAGPPVRGDAVTVLPYPLRARPAPPAPRGPQLVVGFFGHWYPGKGIETLLAAHRRAADDGQAIRLRLLGDAFRFGGRRSAYRSRVLKSIDRSRLRHLIDVTGFVGDEALGAELAACDAIVLPFEERRSARGLASVSAAAFDALGAGVPVVAGAARALPDVVTHGEDGLLFEAGDAEALAAVLRRLRDEPALRARLREGARRTAASLSPERTARAALAAYGEILR